ncbi:MAG: cell division protein SepF [Coriobacteriia bacterium]|nr:cell division protein SepF [Coriobacteriia bacterium]
MGFLDDLKEKIGIDDTVADDIDDELESPYGRRSDNLEVDRYESPYDEGGSSNVVRRSRTPDVRRASVATGAPLRDVPHIRAPRVETRAAGQTLVHNARPTSFNDCGLIADRYKGGQPVIIDLNSIPFDEQRRFLDFVSGLIYGLDGEISKVSAGIYLIAPQGSHVSDADRARFAQRQR